MSEAKQAAQTPRYRLTAKAYINDRLLDPESMAVDPDSEDGERKPLIISYEGVPGWHMEPVNDAARAMKAKAPKYSDPILAMTSITAESAAGKA